LERALLPRVLLPGRVRLRRRHHLVRLLVALRAAPEAADRRAGAGAGAGLAHDRAADDAEHGALRGALDRAARDVRAAAAAPVRRRDRARRLLGGERVEARLLRRERLALGAVRGGLLRRRRRGRGRRRLLAAREQERRDERARSVHGDLPRARRLALVGRSEVALV